MKLLISCVFTSLMVVMSTTMLIPCRMKRQRVAIIAAYVFAMAFLGNTFGQIMGIPMVIGLLILLFLLTEEYRLENGFMAAVGYLINILCNNMFFWGIVALLGIPLVDFVDHYGEVFWAVYTVFLWLLFQVI